MYGLLQTADRCEALRVQLPAFAVALGLAEFFFRFGSFSLECIAFLLVWGGLATLLRALQKRAAGGQ